MDERNVTIGNEEHTMAAVFEERCMIIERMLERKIIITDSLLRAILDVEVPEDELSI